MPLAVDPGTVALITLAMDLLERAIGIAARQIDPLTEEERDALQARARDLVAKLQAMPD